MAKVAVNGVALHYVDEGRGDPPFVFIHGWACDHTFWLPQVADLSRDHRCIAIDLRGRGSSEALPPFDTTSAADDVAALIRELHLGPAIVVGHSLGGLVALLLNDRHPELVLGTVLGDSPLTAAERGAFPRTVQAITDAGTTEILSDMVEGWFVEDTPHDIRESARRTVFSCPADVAAGMLSNDAVFVDRLPELVKEADQKPFMAFWSQNPLGDPAKLREWTMFLRQEPIAGAGHFFQLERPAVTNALLRAFLDDVRRDPRLQRQES